MFKVINKDKYMNDLGQGEVRLEERWVKGCRGVPFSLLCQQKINFSTNTAGIQNVTWKLSQP